MEQDRKHQLPIAEEFHSVQGEGRWAGTPMHFIRLAGCSVGISPSTLIRDAPSSVLPILKTGSMAWLCHTYDNRTFWCDTDFNLREWIDVESLLDDTWERHICLTGGEPLLHKDRFDDFFFWCDLRGIHVHIETSGTIQLTKPDNVWISVSPKLNVLDDMIVEADEIKLLVDDQFDIYKLPTSILEHHQVFVQPINDENMVRRDNYELCMKVLRQRPDWHLSVQLHKFLNVR